LIFSVISFDDRRLLDKLNKLVASEAGVGVASTGISGFLISGESSTSFEYSLGIAVDVVVVGDRGVTVAVGLVAGTVMLGERGGDAGVKSLFGWGSLCGF